MAAVPFFDLGPDLLVEATEEQKAEYLAPKNQSGDLTALTRRTVKSVAVGVSKEAAAGAPVEVKQIVKPMFGGPKRGAAASSGAAAAAAAAPTTTTKKKVAAASGAAAAAAAPPVKQPEERKAPTDFSSYSADVQPYAIQIATTEADNPYVDPTPNPVLPLASRLGFQKQIMRVYRKFRKVPELGQEPDYDACKKMSSGAQQEVTMYEYQKFVREYMRQASPYRGLLVYHGLGSGKTCSAIAAAEALMSVSSKKVIVMTPSSLRDNFIREITFCGFRHLRLQNYWVELTKDDPTVQLFASEILGLRPQFIKKATTIWVPDFSQAEPNFNTLDAESRQQIVKQIAEQISSRITFINYNGVSAKRLKRWACAAPNEEGYGLFDNKVIVVDEIHNLIRLMQGSIDPYIEMIPGKKRKIPFEPIEPGPWNPALCAKALDSSKPYLTNYKRGYMLYRMLVGARDSKVIGLSGTPLINYPEELGILVNVLQGYIHTCAFFVKDASDAKRKQVEQILKDHPFTDFVEVVPQGANLSVLFTILPEGHVKATAKDGSFGVQATGDDTPTIFQVADELVGLLSSKGMSLVKPPTFQSEPRLPPTHDAFADAFLNGTDLKNDIVLMKRMQGTVSYYRGSKKELMPAVIRDELVRVPMSAYVQNRYQAVRNKELKVEEKQKKKKSGSQAVAAKASAVLSSIYGMPPSSQSSSYRVFSRQACNFAFPENIERPLPLEANEVIMDAGQDIEFPDSAVEEIPAVEGEDQIVAALANAAKEELAAGEEEEEDQAELMAEDAEIEQAEHADIAADLRAEGKEEEAEAEELDDDEAALAVAAAAEEESGAAAAAAEPLKGGGGPDSPNAAAGAAAAPSSGAAAAAPTGQKKTLSTAAQLLAEKKAAQERLIEQCKAGRAPGEPYLVATRRAKQCLKTFAKEKLRLYSLKSDTMAELTKGTPPDPNLLAKYSPKYAEILQRIFTSPGSSLVYSQFLDMEGIGIFNIVMQCNDFLPIEIVEAASGDYRFSPLTLLSLKKGPGANRYISFTGSEERSIRNLALKLFNARYAEDETGGRFIDLPPAMSAELVKHGFTGNLRGELCRVFCITSAGAEGLSLRNVRRVHIMEPYWNPVRTDQVKGRAVRICSHVDLEWSAVPEENQRTVEVFTYCSVFAEQALIHPDGTGGYPVIPETIIMKEGVEAVSAVKEGLPIPKGARFYVYTTDEYMYGMSENKRKVMANLQNIMKASAVDCTLNEYENEEDGIVCVQLPGTTSQYAYHPVLAKDIAETASAYRRGDYAKPSSGEAVAALEDIAGAAAAPAAPVAAEEAVEEKEDGGAAAAAAPSVGAAKVAVKPKTIKARLFTYKGKQYMAVPELKAGMSVPLMYQLYEPGDRMQRISIGTMTASPSGGLTNDILLFD